MTTALSEEEEALVVTHEVVEVRPSSRKRLITGAALVVTGLVIFLAWGIGARNGDAAFQVSQFGDRWQIGNLRFPGGAVAMIMGVVVVLLGVGQLVRGYTKSQMRWVVAATLLLFILAFLAWAGTGSPQNPISLSGLVQNSITASIPYVLGALAGIVCERSGVINIAIEGQMLVGAFAGAMFASSADSLGIGLAAAMLGGALIGILLAVFAIRYIVNQVVLGVVLNTFALGLTNLGFHAIMSGEKNAAKYNAGATLGPIKIPLLGDLPVIGQALFNVNIIVYITYGLIVVIDVGLFRTRWGLRTRAVGEHPKAADTVGIKVNRIRYRNVVIGGLIAGLAGAALTIGGSGQFNANISSGKGFIALAAVIFGRWSPRGAIAAALLFGFTDQLQITLGIVGTPVQIPSAFLSMAPYVATVIAVAGLVGRVQAPAADGEPYVKG
ncbi:MAG: ral nucleoside transport system permease protein [Pseudonocardiales bacterium]|jgi:simple sugar transport system permease protein|nr:ral nucleoside transport system permease protein [Pseudonocardiales bacterium]